MRKQFHSSKTYNLSSINFGDRKTSKPEIQTQKPKACRGFVRDLRLRKMTGVLVVGEHGVIRKSTRDRRDQKLGVGAEARNPGELWELQYSRSENTC